MFMVFHVEHFCNKVMPRSGVVLKMFHVEHLLVDFRRKYLISNRLSMN